jgi:hypothetical protein
MLKMLLDPNGGENSECRFSFTCLSSRRPRNNPFAAGIVLTNDGNAILREIDVSHPAAKVRDHYAGRVPALQTLC